MNWQTAKDRQAPAGWTTSGFDGDVGDRGPEDAQHQQLCANGWNAYAFNKGQGRLSAKMKGSGTLTAKYRDCWAKGSATVYLNGQQKGQSGTNNGALATTRCSGSVTCNVPHNPSQRTLVPRSFDFEDGDTLSFKDTGNKGVLQIVSITYQCKGTASTPIRCLDECIMVSKPRPFAVES